MAYGSTSTLEWMLWSPFVTLIGLVTLTVVVPPLALLFSWVLISSPDNPRNSLLCVAPLLKLNVAQLPTLLLKSNGFGRYFLSLVFWYKFPSVSFVITPSPLILLTTLFFTVAVSISKWITTLFMRSFLVATCK